MDKYKKLKEELKQANDAYYKQSSPIMSDYEFDMKLAQLVDIEKRQGFADLDSPTQKPGSDLSSSISSNKHNRPMLSLENTYNESDVKDWYDKRSKETNETSPTVVVEMKYDGGSAAIRFLNGKIVKALTRGDGEIGEDITNNVSLMSEFNTVSSSFTGEVRGELIITRDGFAKLNDDNKYQNARNLLSGTMKLLNPKEFKKREKYIRFYAYWNESDPYKNHLDNISCLKKNGFRIPEMTLCSSYDDVMHAIKKIETLKPSLDIDIDGAVMKLNETKYWNKIGSTAKFPRWAKAYKYKQETAETTIRKITFEVGRSGKITPLAWFDPVFIDGSTIQKATLNNADFYNTMDIGIGDTVRVQKAAAIIPQIIEVKHTKNRKVVPFPNVCPCCGSELDKHDEAEADWYCENIDCPARVVNTIVNYTHTLEIDGFAEVLVSRRHDAGYLKSIKDLYNLKEHRGELARLDRRSFNIVDKLISNVEKGKSADFWKCLAGLGIPNIGAKTAKTLVKHFKNIDNLMNATEIKLMEVSDIAEITAHSIYSWFHTPRNIEIINFLKNIGQNMEIFSEDNNNSLAGKSFCITGALSIPREKYEELIEAHGGKLVSGVTKKTTYLVTNDPTTQTKKNITAKQLGIPIIDEKTLKQMLK